MKNIKSILLSAVLAGLLGSCAPEYYPDGRIDKKEIFATDRKTFSYLNLCYQQLNEIVEGQWYGNQSFLSAFTDDAYDANTVDNSSSARYWAGTSTAYDFQIESGANWNIWGRYYQGINHCNTFLENIDEATVLDEDDRISWKAQAMVLRAYYSLQLAKRYGTIPYSTKAYDADFDFGSAEFKTFSEVARQILKDCNDAIATEHLVWTATNDMTRGMMTYGVTYAIMSQTALYAASPLYNDGTFTWSEAAKICKESLDALSANGYSLFTKAGTASQNISAYETYFNTRPDYSRTIDKETILEVRNQMSVWTDHGLPSTQGAITAGNCPTQELVDCYETVDGEMPILGYSDENHLRPIINPNAQNYSEQDPYANRDPRMASSIYYHGGRKLLNNSNSKVDISQNGAESIDLLKVDKTHTPTGYYLRKYGNFASNLNTNADGYFRRFRYAEILLNYAEAAAEAGEVPKEAYDAVNEVRDRVKMPKLEGLSREEFIKRVHNERRVEFAFEESRYFDMRRWKELGSTCKVATGMKVTANDDGTYKYERIVVDAGRQCYGDKYLLSPIPGMEAIRIQKLTGVNHQNPGWE